MFLFRIMSSILTSPNLSRIVQLYLHQGPNEPIIMLLFKIPCLGPDSRLAKNVSFEEKAILEVYPQCTLRIQY